MSTRKRNESVGKTISIPGLLAVMTGGGLLYSYYTFQWYVGTSLAWKGVVWGGSVLLLVWGANDIVRGFFSSFHGRRRRRWGVFRESAGPLGVRHVLFLFGLAMMAGGIALGYLIAIRAQSSLTVVLAVMAGVLAFVAGLRNVVNALQPARAHAYSFKRQRLPLPGLVYLAMMSSFFVGSLIGRSNMLMLVFCFMAGPFVINGWVTLRMLALTRVSRKLRRTVMAGEPLDVELTLENGKSIMSSWLMDVTDRIVGNGEELQTGVLFMRVPPGQSRSASYQLRLMHRGRYRFGPLMVSSRFPLGIVERGLAFDADAEVIVFPRLGRLTAAWEQESLLALELVEKENPHSGIYDDEFHRLREFRWGDNPRAIHWRTAARRNELMVREYHQSRDRDLVILLDLWAPGKPGEADLARVETAISFAATVAIEQMRDSRESVVTLAAAGKDFQRWQGQAGPAAFESLLEMLALLEPGKSLDVATLRERAGSATSGSVRTILITTQRRRTIRENSVGPPGIRIPKNSGLPSAAAQDSEFRDATGEFHYGKGLERFTADSESLSRYFLSPIAEKR